jgi:glycosyltransferase involved in cell wall biosynthesis
VLAVGGIEPRKGSRVLLAAIAELRHAVPGVLLVIAGGETLFDYAAYREGWWSDAERLGIRVHQGRDPVPSDADVVVLGPVEDELMPTLYKACDVLAFPSTLEGFGLVVLEALAAGTPAVVSDLPVLREHLRDGRDCLMVGVDDPAALAGALGRVIGDRHLRERLIEAGRETAARFTWAACAEHHEHIYRRIHAG